MNNKEGLTREEILAKIKYLETNINRAIMRGNGRYTENRENRVATLKSYL